jgi:hypothetical protein
MEIIVDTLARQALSEAPAAGGWASATHLRLLPRPKRAERAAPTDIALARLVPVKNWLSVNRQRVVVVGMADIVGGVELLVDRVRPVAIALLVAEAHTPHRDEVILAVP